MGIEKMQTMTNVLKEIVTMIPDELNVLSLKDMKEAVVDGVTHYRLQNGKATSVSLYDKSTASVAETTIPKGVYWPEHTHIAPVKYEVVIILHGILRMVIDGEICVLKKDDIKIINQNVLHDALAITDVVLISLTVPRDEGYPK